MSERNRKDEANSGVEAVERALRLLDVFGPADQGLSLKEVSERSGINKVQYFASLSRSKNMGTSRVTEKVCFTLVQRFGDLVLFSGKVFAWVPLSGPYFRNL